MIIEALYPYIWEIYKNDQNKISARKFIFNYLNFGIFIIAFTFYNDKINAKKFNKL